MPLPLKTPELHANWPQLLRRAWSIRLILLAGVLSFADVVCSVFQAHPPFDPVWFAVFAGLVSMAALIARLVAQSNIGAAE